MSWSVSATGKSAEVKAEMEKQFTYPLSPAPAGLSDEGERETVRLVSEMIAQCLGTFDPDKEVAVSAAGHLAYNNWGEKTGKYQHVTLSIQPKG